MKKRLYIDIGGEYASGKTTVATLITKTLNEKGIKCELYEGYPSLNDENLTDEDTTRNIENLKGGDFEVVIKTYQIRRQVNI